MADTFIKDNDGNYMKDSNGIYLKSRQFNQQVIQDGLSFWGSADPAFLTLVDGKVSEAYDIRGTGAKMIQNTATDRPISSSNYLRFTNKEYLSIVGQNYSSKFIVMKLNSTTIQWKGLGSLNSVIGYITALGYFVPSTVRDHYLNGVKKTTTTTGNTNKNIIHSLFNAGASNVTMRLGSINTESYAATYDIFEWGWYNRVLSEQEVIYNINALNAKHMVF